MEIAKDKLRLQETERPRKKASPRDLIQNHAPVLEKDLDTRERRYRQMRRWTLLLRLSSHPWFF
eukprot:1392903-Amorphochlora_amoeboformis.AAC.1